MSIGIVGAFFAGVLTLISPCSALLVPAFFAYAFTSTRQLVGKTLLFFLGLCVTLVPIGTGLAAFFAQYRDQVIHVAGWIIIALGVYTALGGGFRIPGMAAASGKARGRVFLLGAVYGFAGFCAGPLLGAVLTTAAASGSAGYGALIMVVYALGMAAPLFVLALVWDRFDVGSWRWLRGRELSLGPLRTNSISVLSGLLFVVIGVLFILSNGTAALPTALDTDAQFALQDQVRRFSEGIHDAWVWFALSLAATVGVGIKAARTEAR
ncbi:cytochrome c biogenesis CcdA family protein [Corynebacterium sp.]|uniref:cytochrome c biogenesis CcdA family protein n=1 Tax=Corynebacterium sp. TaxID=1720 RepID=UPI0026DB4D64|nr:cytochrome c biogenesis CcdA family protein [Corynebacterium sp.]MDO5031892.1 cytochrome c biogenesis CcdA family protein [Corynebacterium sp.]